MTDKPDDQREVVDFLSNCANYPVRGEAVERVDTHCSSVFLVDDRAYKLKHAIAFSSLDYTSVALRERACRAELALNRRTAPDLYLDVMSITRNADGSLRFDGPGVPVDWVVVMRRLDRNNLFDRMADENRLTPDLLRSLGEEIARFHAVAEITPGFGGAAGIQGAIADNLREMTLRFDVKDGWRVRELHDAALAALDRSAALLDRRRAAGKVRRCHGDLRLANICLVGHRPTLFDCIEFSDEISCIDVLYDLAFLLVDLRHRGLDDLAAVTLTRYIELTGDAEGLAAMPLFLSVRAATRSYGVAGGAMRAKDPAMAARLGAQAEALLVLAAASLGDEGGSGF